MDKLDLVTLYPKHKTIVLFKLSLSVKSEAANKDLYYRVTNTKSNVKSVKKTMVMLAHRRK